MSLILEQLESGIAARRALSEGRPPRDVALAWFKQEMNLTPVGISSFQESSRITSFHLFSMVLLVVFAVAMLVLYFFKMCRAAELFGRIEASKGPPPPGAPPELAGGKPPPKDPPPIGPPPGDETPSGGGKPSPTAPPDTPVSPTAEPASILPVESTTRAGTHDTGDAAKLAARAHELWEARGRPASYYHIEYAGGPMKIIAADGTDVQPVETGRFLFAIAETYDLVVKVPTKGGAWELRATTHDGTGQSSLFIGQEERHAASDVPKPNVYKLMAGMGDMAGMSGMSENKSPDHSSMAGMGEGDMAPSAPAMDHSKMDEMKNTPSSNQAMEMDSMADMKGMDHGTMPMPAEKDGSATKKAMPPMAGMQGMDDPERPGSPYEKLRALRSTVISDSRPLREYTFRLTGDMIRFVWTLNGKTFSEADMINVRRGEKVRFTFINDSMMHHPMHLHGHFFRLVTSAGNLSPMKHTIDVPPMASHTIEFAADEQGDWMMHCHVLYHLAIGMARVVHYEDGPPNPHLMTDTMKTEHDPKLLFGEGILLSNMTEGTVSLQNNRNGLTGHWQSRIGNGSETDYELGLDYDRFLTSNLSTFASYEWSNGTNTDRGMFGARYLLPFLIQSQVSVDTEGDFRFTAGKAFPITSRFSVFGRAQYDTKASWETSAGAEYFLHRNLSIVGQWHNEYGVGGGVALRF